MKTFSRFSTIEPRDRVRILGAAVGFICVAVANLLIRIGGDTLFLSAYSRETLASLYLATAVIVSLLASLFGLLSGRIPVHRLIAASSLFLVVLVVGVRVALGAEIRAAKLAAYLLADLTVNGTMLLFWSFFAQLFDSREAKQYIGFVGAAGTAACMAAALAVGPFNRSLGVENLLVVVAILLAAFALVVQLLASGSRERSPQRRERPPSSGSRPGVRYRLRLLLNENIRGLAAMVGVATVTVTLVDFQFKAAAQSTFSAAELPGFFGNFYAAANVVVLLIQLLAVSWLLRKGGLLLSLCLLPAALLLTSSLTVFGPEFSGVVASRFAVQIMVFTVDTAALHVLYLGVRKQSYSQARAFVDGICKPVAMGLTGFLLFFGSSRVGFQGLALAAAAAALVWIFLARTNYRTYLNALVEGLRAKLIYPGERPEGQPDRTVEHYVRERLLTAPPEDLPYLLTVLGEFRDLDLNPEMRLLLQRDEPDVKVVALERLRETSEAADLDLVLAQREHPEPMVRRAVVTTASVLGGQSVSEALALALDDPEPEVRAEAAVALIQLADLNGLMLGVQTLKNLIDSTEPRDRRATARPLARVHLPGRQNLMRKLLTDPEIKVRRAALEACVERPDEGLVPTLAGQLSDPGLSGLAVDALVNAAGGTLSYLESLDEDGLKRAFDRGPLLYLVLSRIGGDRALSSLRRLSGRTYISWAFADCFRRLLQHRRPSAGETAEVNRMVDGQLRLLGERRMTLRALDGLAGTDFLQGALDAEIAAHVRNLFLFLEILVPGVDMDVFRLKVTRGRPEDRAKALDVLESLLPLNLRTRVLRVLDPKRAAAGPVSDPFSKLLESEVVPSILAGAVFAAGRNERRDLVGSIRPLLGHDVPLCRETALDALCRLDENSGNVVLVDDPDPSVRRFARTLGGDDGEECPMITVERVLFLRHVPLFSQMSAAELSALARITEEAVFPAGSQILVEGELGETLYLVVDGEVLIHSGDKRLGVLKSEDHFGEMAILDGEPRSASATALTDCLLLTVNRRDFNDLLNQHVAVARAVITTLNERLRNTIGLLRSAEN